MPYSLTVATPATRELVVEAMRARADTLKRAATRAAADVEADRADGRDVRSRAVKLATMLAQASTLEDLARELEGLEELALVESEPGLRLVPIPDPSGAPLMSEALAAAHAALEAAGKPVTARALIEQLEAAGVERTGGDLEPAPGVYRPDQLDHPPTPAPAEVDDDGLSPEAHRLADAAGLTDTVIEDATTGALPEDEPTPDDVVDITAALAADPAGATP